VRKIYRPDYRKHHGVIPEAQKIWKSRTISLQTKLRLLKALMWSVATHGCESWTLRKPDQRKIDAFEQKTYRRLLRLPWTAKKSNDSVLQKTGTDSQLLKSIMRRKLGYFGHIMRRSGECLDSGENSDSGMYRRKQARRDTGKNLD